MKMNQVDPVEAGKRIQEALTTPEPERSIEEWLNDVGPGWRLLVSGLDRNLRDLDPDYKIGQVKEKFGGLRFYIDSFNGDIETANKLVNIAEEASFKICEDCGGPGVWSVRGGFGYRTLCPLCAKNHENKILTEDD